MALRADASRAADRRKKSFMKGIDADDARRKREDNIIELRKNKRDENLQKKRMIHTPGGSEDSSRSLEDSTRNTQKVGLLLQSSSCRFWVSFLNMREWHLTASRSEDALPVQLDNLPSMVQGVYSEDVNQQLEATMQFRKLLSIGRGLCSRCRSSPARKCEALINIPAVQSAILQLRRSSTKGSFLVLSSFCRDLTSSSFRQAFVLVFVKLRFLCLSGAC